MFILFFMMIFMAVTTYFCVEEFAKHLNLSHDISAQKKDDRTELEGSDMT